MDASKDLNSRTLWLLTIWHKYLHTSWLIFKMNAESWNIHVMSGYGPCEITQEEYSNTTKWSDFNVSVPALFLFFHWIELILKWLLLKFWKQFNGNHKLTEHLDELNQLSCNHVLLKIFSKYIYYHNDDNHDLLHNLLKTNNLKDFDDLYIFLRYPYSYKHSQIYNYLPIKYKETEFLNFSNDIIKDINIILEESIKIYRS